MIRKHLPLLTALFSGIIQICQSKPYEKPNFLIFLLDDLGYSDFITQKSLDLIDSYSKDNKPFFLYVAHTALHWPLHALSSDFP